MRPEEADDPSKRTKLILIVVGVVLALGLAIWSGFRALDTRPRVTGVLGEDPAMTSTGGGK
ncbi:MAG: hypothetical protein SFU56_06395 [Capsulimonadales bacterium]|nr:hypothetical protein [Capsulimonadales bacterium]